MRDVRSKRQICTSHTAKHAATELHIPCIRRSFHTPHYAAPRPQVCSLQWSRYEREILSSHGYSKNQLCLWKYPSLVKVGGTGPSTAAFLLSAMLLLVPCKVQITDCVIAQRTAAHPSSDLWAGRALANLDSPLD